MTLNRLWIIIEDSISMATKYKIDEVNFIKMKDLTSSK